MRDIDKEWLQKFRLKEQGSWKSIRKNATPSLSLENGKSYKCRMCVGVGINEDLYDEFECVYWDDPWYVFICKETYQRYDRVDMDDIWVEGE